MSSFEVKARRVKVFPHPNADRLDLVQVDDYRAVVGKDSIANNGAAIYIPEQAIVPEEILRELGLWDEEKQRGKLSGSAGNRVKAVRLRGELSQGLIYRPSWGLVLGQDYGEQLGIHKWEPPIPIEMAGQLVSCPTIKTYTDVDNIKKFPDVIQPGEEVVMVEKAHGTCSIFHLSEQGEFYVSSKGIAQRNVAGIIETDSNVYWRAARQYGIEEKLRALIEDEGLTKGVTLYGETMGVQDLKYGYDGGKVGFAAFDLYEHGGHYEYFHYDHFLRFMERYDIPVLPELFRGPFSKEALDAATNGTEQITGSEAHIREGVVVRPLRERYDPTLGRVILKSVSADYLTRRGKVTEYA